MRKTGVSWIRRGDQRLSSSSRSARSRVGIQDGIDQGKPRLEQTYSGSERGVGREGRKEREKEVVAFSVESRVPFKGEMRGVTQH